jgi:ubiquinone biosynthesis protein
MKYRLGDEVLAAVKQKLSRRVSVRAVPRNVRQSKSKTRPLPVRLRLALQDMGPTFVKLGQFLSTRPDLLPEEFTTELGKLQDRVPPVKFQQIREELEKQLGGSVEKMFQRFDARALAAGSIAQVHRARTRDGKDIVLKIRRPGVVQRVRTECEILETLAGLWKTDDPHQSIDPQRMVREFTSAVKKEVDLSIERQNLQRFARNFEGDQSVHLPEVYEEFCSEGVLAMEFIEGVRPGSAEALQGNGLDPRLVARRGADFVLKQIFEFGFFHSDPHPGNFFLREGEVLVPLDFGQVARLTPRDRKLLMDLVLTIVHQDVPRLARALSQADMVPEQTDLQDLTADLEDMLDRYYNLPLDEIPFRRALSEGFSLMRTHHVHPPEQFALMVKSLMTIESLAISLDPDFDILETLKPYARKFSLEQFAPSKIARQAKLALLDTGRLLARLPDDADAIISKFRKGQMLLRVNHEHLDDLEDTLDKSSNRISFALIIAALLVASSMLVGQERKLLGFVRIQTLGLTGYFVAAVMGFWLLISMIRGRR